MDQKNAVSSEELESEYAELVLKSAELSGYVTRAMVEIATGMQSLRDTIAANTGRSIAERAALESAGRKLRQANADFEEAFKEKNALLEALYKKVHSSGRCPHADCPYNKILDAAADAGVERANG